MNTKKAYQMLVVVLFFAFVSLISRSIIYLILSVAIATMILSLLKNAKKATDGQLAAKKTLANQDIKLHKFLIVTTIVGALMIGYGSLYYSDNSIFEQLISTPTHLYTAILIICGGFFIVLSSLYFIIREILVADKGTSNHFCEHCGTKNKSKHLYCSNCGERL